MSNKVSNIIRLEVYNVLGQILETLVNEKQAQGVYEVEWDASKYASGIYFYRMRAGKSVKTKKMTLVK